MDRGVSLLLSFWTTNTNSSLCPETFLLQNISDDRLSGQFSTVDARGNPLKGKLLNFEMNDMVKVKRPSVLRKRTNAAAVGSSTGFEPIEKKMSNEEKSNGELACPCPCHCSFSDSVSQQDHGKDSSSGANDVVGAKEITIPPMKFDLGEFLVFFYQGCLKTFSLIVPLFKVVWGERRLGARRGTGTVS